METTDIVQVEVITFKHHIWICPKCGKKNCTGAYLIVKCDSCEGVFIAMGKDDINKEDD